MLRYTRWTTPVACLLSVALVTSMARAADDTDQPNADVTLDVTEQVEVTTTGLPRTDRQGNLFTGVVVTNSSDEVLSGRLVVVVDETGLLGVSMGENDGALESGEAYVEVLPLTGKLKPGRKTTSKRIDFTAEAALTLAERKVFAPTFRVLQVGPEKTEAPTEELADVEPNLPGKSYTQSRLNEVMRIQDKYTNQIVSKPGVFGTATSEDENGNPVILVYTQRHGIIKTLPGQYDGVPLEQAVTGTMFRAGPAWAEKFKGHGYQLRPDLEPQPANPQGVGTVVPTDPSQAFPTPIPIGVSMCDGDDDDCTAGTIGCRIVFADGTLGALTNSHVGAQESEPDALREDLTNGVVGDQWIQPGQADGGFIGSTTTTAFATLIDYQDFIQPPADDAPFGPTYNNYIDAAVGRLNFPNRGMLQACTPVDGYGFPSRNPVAPIPRTRVMKYGRTTGLRRGEIRGINANVRVGYNDIDIIFFTNQISIYGDHLLFSMGGDSGSLIVTEQGHHPVGLLFAGGGFETLANPIHMVLERFNIAIDDGTGTPPTLGPNGETSTPGSRMSGRMGGAGGRIVPTPLAP